MNNNRIVPLAKRRRGITIFWRRARGFSLGELKEAGLNIYEVRKLGVPVDPRRKSVHEENIKKLKELLKSS
ncbi:MAG: ribosomal protein L13e [Candidatus Brockarchaeota archaeon]|nr:ribosomal protein L13e [Candidatus Brockarchaeota archaeon]